MKNIIKNFTLILHLVACSSYSSKHFCFLKSRGTKQTQITAITKSASQKRDCLQSATNSYYFTYCTANQFHAMHAGTRNDLQVFAPRIQTYHASAMRWRALASQRRTELQSFTEVPPLRPTVTERTGWASRTGPLKPTSANPVESQAHSCRARRMGRKEHGCPFVDFMGRRFEQTLRTARYVRVTCGKKGKRSI